MSDQDGGNGGSNGGGGFGAATYGAGAEAADNLIALGPRIAVETTASFVSLVERVKELMLAAKAPSGDRAALRLAVTMLVNFVYRTLRASGMAPWEARTIVDDICGEAEKTLALNGIDGKTVAVAQAMASAQLKATYDFTLEAVPPYMEVEAGAIAAVPAEAESAADPKGVN